MRKVGIIGGMGPTATVLLFERIIAGTLAHDDAGHIPLLIDNTPQIPSRIAHLIDGTGCDPAPELCRIARGLESAHCAALAMPCNTAHHYAAAIGESVSIPLLDMRYLVAAALVASGVRRVGMLSSPALRLVGVYDAAFAESALQATFPNDDANSLSLIRAIKAGQPPDQAVMRCVLEELEDTGAEAILVGCSEFSLYAAELPTHLPCVDSIDVLAESVIAFASCPARPD